MLEFVIHSETPSKKNSRIFLKNGRNIPSKRYQEWHSKARIEIIAQAMEQSETIIKNTKAIEPLNFAIPIDTEIEISMSFYHSDNRRRDSDNGASSVLDLLQDCGIIADDKWQIVRDLHIHNYYDKNARCEISIYQYKAAKELNEGL